MSGKRRFTEEERKQRHADSNKRWREKNIERVREQEIRYREAHRAQAAEKARNWYAANREQEVERNRNRVLKRKYGMTPEGYNQILAAQGGQCAVCGKMPNGKWLVVDHNHTTGIVRGLLCDKCNRGLGLLGDGLEPLGRAIQYLQRASAAEAEQ